MNPEPAGMVDDVRVRVPRSVDVPSISLDDDYGRGVAHDVVFDVSKLNVFYGSFRAVRDVDLQINRNEITALIGPSGCGKSTVRSTTTSRSARA